MGRWTQMTKSHENFGKDKHQEKDKRGKGGERDGGGKGGCD
jgi:hypothetical protein